MKKIISIVVPCYNEEKSIGVFYDEIIKVFKKISKYDFEIIFVVDPSPDDSFAAIRKLNSIDKKVKYDDLRSEYLYNCATGCTIISKKEFLKYILPLPKKSEFMPHDYWITLVVALKGKIAHLDEKLIKYRQHGNNIIGSEKTSHKFSKFEQVRELFIRVKLEHFEDYVERTEVFTKEQNEFNKKCLEYFKDIKEKKYINLKHLGVFHRLYKYDRISYYVIQWTIMNLPIVAKIAFVIRYKILKLLKKR